ncbi:MAG: type II toxin-antitoxin system prevent-host-death family antitoxin [Thiobacillaceae bacterium]|nr:type II toxin-antitoxin system prevent-host-death family antitoxin [Thiobacillaceae bacterium]MCX7672177.1 type II toxin-antitoxin system prevent-host-death family antitoxin [Thiobacillaceae bacterium]MDW8324052.1 type II toxin-antitoxin system prevent-host-death family antitoxin [Burkholderiales bacterium]
MQVNMHEAKSQLSRLVRAALAGEEVIIAQHGVPVVRLVPVPRTVRTGGWGCLDLDPAAVDAAFTPEVEAAVAAQFTSVD